MPISMQFKQISRLKKNYSNLKQREKVKRVIKQIN